MRDDSPVRVAPRGGGFVNPSPLHNTEMKVSTSRVTFLIRARHSASPRARHNRFAGPLIAHPSAIDLRPESDDRFRCIAGPPPSGGDDSAPRRPFSLSAALLLRTRGAAPVRRCSSRAPAAQRRLQAHCSSGGGGGGSGHVEDLQAQRDLERLFRLADLNARRGADPGTPRFFDDDDDSDGEGGGGAAANEPPPPPGGGGLSYSDHDTDGPVVDGKHDGQHNHTTSDDIDDNHLHDWDIRVLIDHDTDGPVVDGKHDGQHDANAVGPNAVHAVPSTPPVKPRGSPPPAEAPDAASPRARYLPARELRGTIMFLVHCEANGVSPRDTSRDGSAARERALLRKRHVARWQIHIILLDGARAERDWIAEELDAIEDEMWCACGFMENERLDELLRQIQEVSKAAVNDFMSPSTVTVSDAVPVEKKLEEGTTTDTTAMKTSPCHFDEGTMVRVLG